MLESIKTFWNQVGRKNGFWIPVLFFTISTYGFSIFNRTVGIDDLAADLYVGSGNVMIAAGRWGMILWNKWAAAFVLMAAIGEKEVFSNAAMNC